MALLHDTAKAFRQATGAHTPNVTIERVWPVYAILDERADGSIESEALTVVEHGFRGVPVATAEETVKAQKLLLAAWRNNPVEVYHDFRLDAHRAARTDGDYTECILKTAAAAELLIKHTAWMTVWEGTEVLAVDPFPTAASFPNSDSKPADLIGRILAPRLKGNWSSQSAQQPIGAWRHHIAKRRNAVIHLGYRPTAGEADDALAALGELEQHVILRLTAQRRVYPITTLQLVGRDGLERRQAFDEVRTMFDTENLATRLREYLDWVERYLDSSA